MSTLGSIVGVLLLPIATRLYDESDFGELAFAVAIIALLANCMTGKLELAVAPASGDQSRREILALAHRLVLGTGAVLSLLLLASQALRTEFRMTEWLVLLGAVLFGTLILLQARSLAENRVHRVASAKAALSVSEPGFQISLGLAAIPVTGKLLFAYCLAHAAACGVLFRRDQAGERVEMSQHFETIKTHRRYITHSVPAYLVNAITVHGVPLFLAYGFGTGSLGELSVVQRTFGAVCFLLSGVFAQLYFHAVATEGSYSQQQHRRTYMLFGRLLLVTAAILMAILYACAPYLGFLLGENWDIQVELVRTLSALYCVQLAVVPLSQTLNFAGRQRMQLAWDIFRSGAIALVLALCWLWRVNFLATIQIFVASMCVCYIIQVAFHLQALNQGRKE